MSIYTKTGDMGETSLIGGVRVSKADLRLNAYGSIDEFNSFLGLLRSKLKDADEKQFIEKIQKSLFTIGAILATPSNAKQPNNIEFDDSLIDLTEKQIDRLQKKIPPISEFIVYGYNEISSVCHICRAVLRRAEREIVALNQKEQVNKNILIYINRLSDFLFTFARHLANE
ncbi:MAG: cob(I)yrinic acid a,c-diamide adenosyltransferase [Prevotellaceae bacterium]|jgi:cob(I)alamin adenosyltransferase|nr:cob(I)yrinic acid a,c-diamide adenosyltransferase [Prevotellaceae bacterium]